MPFCLSHCSCSLPTCCKRLWIGFLKSRTTTTYFHKRLYGKNRKRLNGQGAIQYGKEKRSQWHVKLSMYTWLIESSQSKTVSVKKVKVELKTDGKQVIFPLVKYGHPAPFRSEIWWTWWNSQAEGRLLLCNIHHTPGW